MANVWLVPEAIGNHAVDHMPYHPTEISIAFLKQGHLTPPNNPDSAEREHIYGVRLYRVLL
jgi:hypothetical protein